MVQFAGGYGLVIGVSEYDNPDWNVPIAERDAQALHAALTDPDIGAYERGRVSLLLGKAAARDRIAEELRILAEQADERSTVFIAFTGHGALGDDKLYYLGSSDAQLSDDLRLIRKNSGYNIARLATALQAIKAQQLLVVINACASGHLSDLADRGGLGSTVIPPDEGRQILASGRGRALITASRPDELSHFRRDDQHSYFGRALVKGLEGVGVSPQSGYVGLFELYSTIFTQVQNAARAAGVAQHPGLNLVDGEGPFPVARYPQSVQASPGLIQQSPPPGTDVHMVQIQYTDNRVSDNRKVIDFGSAQIGSVTFRGDVAQGDITKTYYGGQPADDAGDEQSDPIEVLQKAHRQVAIAKFVDEYERDQAALKINHARKLLSDGSTARARQLLDEAIVALEAMNNGYINSAVKKLREVRAAL